MSRLIEQGAPAGLPVIPRGSGPPGGCRVTGSIGAPLIGGFVAPGWEPVRDAFGENFTARDELGAGVAVLAHGQPVVSLHGG